MRWWMARSRFLVALGLLVMLTAPLAAEAQPTACASLTPTGTLRAGLILSNQVLVSRDPVTSDLRGVTISLGKALAERLGVSFQPIGYANPAALVQSFGTDAWDIAFLAYDPNRARDVDFSPPYMEVDNTYLVPPGSTITSVEAADRPGIRIAVPERSAPDLFLSRNLKAARLVRLPGGVDAALDALQTGKADAYAENAHMLSLYAEKLPGARVLDGRYTIIRHAIATAKGKPGGADCVRAFVEQAKADGTIAEAIRRAGIRRASVAPQAPGR